MAFSHTKFIKAEYRVTLSGDYLEQRIRLEVGDCNSSPDYHKLAAHNDTILRQLQYLTLFGNLM